VIGMRPIKVTIIGAAFGLLFAAVQAFVNRGDIPPWEWVLLPLIVAGAFLWLSGHFDKPKT
jgi:lipopolysaccharide export LptBFGC system permease protein LptF